MLALRLTPTRYLVSSVSISLKMTHTMNQDLASVQSSFLDPVTSIGDGRSKRIISVVSDSEDVQPEPISCVAELKAR